MFLLLYGTQPDIVSNFYFLSLQDKLIKLFPFYLFIFFKKELIIF